MKIMDILTWKTVIKIPHPEWVLALFWQILVLFWKSEVHLPIHLDNIQIQIKPVYFHTRRYHIFRIDEENQVGIWDESPFTFSVSKEESAIPFIQHEEYRHNLICLLKEIQKEIEPYQEEIPALNLLNLFISKIPFLNWKCPSCKEFLNWCHLFLEKEFSQSGISIAPSTLLFLLQYKNQEDLVDEELIEELTLDFMETALHPFLESFFKIQEQTTLDPYLIIRQLIDILKQNNCSLENIEETEEECGREMKSYLIKTLKYMKTKDIQILAFPRLLTLAREAFRVHVLSFPKRKDRVVIGQAILMKDLFFEDRMITNPPTPSDIVVIHDLEGNQKERHFTEEECSKIIDYHPILRPGLFL